MIQNTEDTTKSASNRTSVIKVYVRANVTGLNAIVIAPTKARREDVLRTRKRIYDDSNNRNPAKIVENRRCSNEQSRIVQAIAPQSECVNSVVLVQPIGRQSCWKTNRWVASAYDQSSFNGKSPCGSTIGMASVKIRISDSTHKKSCLFLSNSPSSLAKS